MSTAAGSPLPPGVVVIGVGTPYKRDDAVGPTVVELLRRRIPGSALADVRAGRLEVVELDGEAARLMQAFRECTFVVDAVRSGAAPGTIHRLDVSELMTGTRGWSPDVHLGGGHLLGVPDAIAMAEVLGRLPRRLVVLGVEGEHFDAGVGLTPVVAAACRHLVDELLADLAAELLPTADTVAVEPLADTSW